MSNNRRVSFIPYNEQTMFSKHIDSPKSGGSKNKVSLKGYSRFSPARFLKHIEAEMAKALQLVSSRRRKVSSSASLARSRSYGEKLDESQRAEAIEDCIEFFNSSSSTLLRSNSVSSSC